MPIVEDKNGIHIEYTIPSNIKNLITDDFLLDCCFLINYHMMPFNWNTEKTKNKWKNIFGEEKYNMLLRFHECDKARCE